jgi:hypothetical protein
VPITSDSASRLRTIASAGCSGRRDQAAVGQWHSYALALAAVDEEPVLVR